MALKLIVDPERFDLKEFHEVRGQPETFLTLPEIVQHLTMR